MDGNWYYSEVLDLEAWLCPALLKYFDDVPKELYVQCKVKRHDAKYPFERTVRGQERTAEAGRDGHEAALLVTPGGVAVQFGSELPRHAMPDPDESHLHRVGARGLLRSGAVLVLFLIVIGNLVLATIGLLGGSRPSRYVFLFFAWIMGITGLVMLAKLWRAMVLLRGIQSGEPTPNVNGRLTTGSTAIAAQVPSKTSEEDR